MAMCILADAADVDRAKLIELDFMTVEDLKKLNKNKKLVKKVSSFSKRGMGWIGDTVDEKRGSQGR